MSQSNPQQEQSHKQKRKNFFIFSFIIFTLIIISTISVFAALKHQIESESLSANPSEAIRVTCELTTFYSTCINSLSSLHNSTQNIESSDILRLSIKSSFDEFLKIHLLPQEMASSKIENKNIKPILIDCQSLFNDSLSQLNASAIMITKAHDLGFDEGMIKGLKNLMLHAKENVDKCVHRLEMTEERIEQGLMCMMNSLDIVEKFHLIQEKFDSSGFRSFFVSFVMKENYVIIIVLGSQYFFLVFLVGSILCGFL